MSYNTIISLNSFIWIGLNNPNSKIFASLRLIEFIIEKKSISRHNSEFLVFSLLKGNLIQTDTKTSWYSIFSFTINTSFVIFGINWLLLRFV